MIQIPNFLIAIRDSSLPNPYEREAVGQAHVDLALELYKEKALSFKTIGTLEIDGECHFFQIEWEFQEKDIIPGITGTVVIDTNMEKLNHDEYYDRFMDIAEHEPALVTSKMFLDGFWVYDLIDKPACRCSACSLPISLKAMRYAILVYQAANSKYGDGDPMVCHAAMAVNNAHRFLHLVEEEWKEMVIATTWMAGVIAFSHAQYPNIETMVSKEIAERTFVLTPHKARTSKDAYNPEYYNDVRQLKYGAYTMICTRMANVQYALLSKNADQLTNYINGMEEFKNNLMQTDNIEYSSVMIQEINDLLKSTHVN